MTIYTVKLASAVSAIALLALPAAAGAGSESPDGNKLLRDCRIHESRSSTSGPVNALATGYCQGFVKGVLQTASFVEPPLVCQPPDGVALGEAIAVVLEYLEEHPERQYLTDMELALEALRQAYPCKKRSARAGENTHGT